MDKNNFYKILFSEKIEELKIHNDLILKLLNSLKNDDLIMAPFENAGTIGKQFRHIITTNETYYYAMISGNLDFYVDSINHSIENNASDLMENFKKTNENIINLIENMNIYRLNEKYINCKKSAKYIDKNYVSPNEIITYITEHTVFHEGELTLYIRSLHKNFPENWMIWGLK